MNSSHDQTTQKGLSNSSLPRKADGSSSASEERALDRAKIIVIDDQEDKLFLLLRLLKRNFPEHPLQSFSNCSSAMSTVRQPGRRMVITNGRVAAQDGIEFTSYVTSKLNIPVVIVSLRSELEDKALKAGAVAFVETGEDSAITQAVAEALATAEK